MAAVMASDSQILALSTMFTEDIFAYYGGRRRFGERAQVQTGRLFIVIITLVAYAVALRAPETIFDLAIQYAFSGFAALSPLLVAALFWRRSTKWGALAATLWTAFAVIWVAIFQAHVPAPAPGQLTVCATLFGFDAVTRTPAGTAIFGFMPVVPMVCVSVLLMIFVSLATKKPQAATLARYFTRERAALSADEERTARAA
jgi:Na+/proline symporter